MKPIRILLLAAICLSYTAHAQHKGNYTSTNSYADPQISRMNISQSNALQYEKRQLNIPGTGEPSNVLDIKIEALQNVTTANYVAVFNLSQLGKTAEETNNLLTERIKNIKTLLSNKGIPNDAIVTDVISFIPAYETEVEKKLFSKKYIEVPVGFELQVNLHIKFSEVSKFEDILDACAKSEVYNLIKVDYFIDNIDLIYKNLEAEIIKGITSKKEFYTKLGFDLADYDPKFAEQKFCYSPKNFYQSYQAYNSTSIEAIEKQKGITTAKKQTSYFYQPLANEQFDIVINPTVLEPVIQVVMQIHLKLTPKPKEQPKPQPIQKPEKEFYIISNNGPVEVKKLDTN